MSTITDIEALLYRHDHVSLRVHGAPADEYRPEAETIAGRLPAATSPADVQQILHEEFGAWFSPDIAGESGHYRAAAEEIWASITHANT